MLNNQIIILTDANTEIGFGHLNRCLFKKIIQANFKF